MKTIIIRNIPADVAAALEAEKQRRGLSLNRTILSVMREALGLSDSRRRSNGLRRRARIWTQAESRQFEEAVAPFGKIDEDMWKWTHLCRIGALVL